MLENLISKNSDEGVMGRWLRIFGIFFVFIVLFTVQPFLIGDPLRIIEGKAQKQILKVGVDRNAPPIEFEQNGQPSGFNIDIANALNARLEQFEFQYIFMDWTDVLNSVQNGSLDIMFATKTDDRELIYDFTYSIINITWAIVVREDVVGISDLNALKGKTVGAVKDFAEYDFLVSNYPEIIVVKVNSTENGLDLLKSGSIFAFFGQQHMILYQLQTHDFSTLKLIGEEYKYEEFCLAIKKGRSDLLQALNQGLKSMFEDGTYDHIYGIWFGSQSFTNITQTIQYSLAIIVTSACIIATILIWNRRLKKEVDKQTKKFMDTYKFFRLLIEDLSYPVAIVKRFGDIIYINPHYTKITGYTLEEIKNQDFYFEKLYPDPEYRKDVREKWDRLQTEPEKYIDKLYEFHINTKNKETKVLQFKIAILENEDIYVIMNDVTEHYELEEKRRQIEKIEAISTVASGIAHDFNNILTSIESLSTLMELDSENEESKQNIRLLRETLNQGKSMTKEMMEFSRRSPLQKEEVEIGELIRKTIDQNFIDEKSRISLKFEPNMPKIQLDKSKIMRVLDNLIRNAIEASDSSSPIEIEIKQYKSSSQNQIIITITDFGKGIPESIKENIFTPYFTTKSKGTGLGLTTSYSIIKNHGGNLSFKSVYGKGTIFSIELPIA